MVNSDGVVSHHDCKLTCKGVVRDHFSDFIMGYYVILLFVSLPRLSFVRFSKGLS